MIIHSTDISIKKGTKYTVNFKKNHSSMACTFLRLAIK